MDTVIISPINASGEPVALEFANDFLFEFPAFSDQDYKSMRVSGDQETLVEAILQVLNDHPDIAWGFNSVEIDAGLVALGPRLGDGSPAKIDDLADMLMQHACDLATGGVPRDKYPRNVAIEGGDIAPDPFERSAALLGDRIHGNGRA